MKENIPERRTAEELRPELAQRSQQTGDISGEAAAASAEGEGSELGGK